MYELRSSYGIYMWACEGGRSWLGRRPRLSTVKHRELLESAVLFSDMWTLRTEALLNEKNKLLAEELNRPTEAC